MDILKIDNITAELKRRAFRKKLSIEVKPSGKVLVRANQTMPKFFIKRYLEKNKDWIEEQLQASSKLRAKHPPKEFFHGEEFLLLGQPLKLQLKKHNLKRPKVILEREGKDYNFSIYSNENLESLDIKKHLVKFYKSQAKDYITLRAEHWAEVTGLKYSKLSFRNQKSVWGTCSTKGVVCLNIKLVAAPLDVIDYVIIHELCHLKHHNHSSVFWNLVAKYEPKYKERKGWLTKNQFAFDFLANTSELHGHQFLE